MRNTARRCKEVVLEKDGTGIFVIIFMLILALFFMSSLGLWGGYPEGAFKKIRELKQEIESLREELKHPPHTHGRGWNISL